MNCHNFFQRLCCMIKARNFVFSHKLNTSMSQVKVSYCRFMFGLHVNILLHKYWCMFAQGYSLDILYLHTVVISAQVFYSRFRLYWCHNCHRLLLSINMTCGPQGNTLSIHLHIVAMLVQFLCQLTCQSADILASLCGMYVRVSYFSDETTRPRDMLFVLKDSLST